MLPLGSRYPVLSPLGYAEPPSGAGGWWDNNGAITGCQAAYQPKGAVSLAASYTDLSGNSNDCGPGVAPGWNAVNGWLFTGTEWLNTGFIPQVDQSQSMLIQYTGVPALASPVMLAGVRTGGGDYFIAPNYTGGIVLYGNGSSNTSAPGLLAGNLGVAGSQGYRNGAPDGGAIPGWGAGGAFSLYIGCWNQVGVAARFVTANIQALSLYDCTLTAPQMAAVAALMAAL